MQSQTRWVRVSPRSTPEHAVTLAPSEIRIRAGTIPQGTVAATQWRWRAQLDSGVEVLHSVTWTADPALQGASHREAAAWRIEIRGRPNVKATIALEDPDPAAPHMRAAVDATVAVALHAIPAVCAAPPGFHTFPPPCNCSAGAGRLTTSRYAS